MTMDETPPSARPPWPEHAPQAERAVPPSGVRAPEGIILDMDSSESPNHGKQEGSAWNGHFGFTCYHLLFLFNQVGDLQCCRLRPG
jgi:hypothetical protein